MIKLILSSPNVLEFHKILFSSHEQRLAEVEREVIPSSLRFGPGFLDNLWQMPGWLMRRLLLVSGFCSKFLNYFLSFDGNLWAMLFVNDHTFLFFFILVYYLLNCIDVC